MPSGRGPDVITRAGIMVGWWAGVGEASRPTVWRSGAHGLGSRQPVRDRLMVRVDETQVVNQ